MIPLAWSVEDIRKKLQNDPDWEPSDADTLDDPDFWEKFDEAMDSLHFGSGGSKDDEDGDFDFDDEDGDW